MHGRTLHNCMSLSSYINCEQLLLLPITNLYNSYLCRGCIPGTSSISEMSPVQLWEVHTHTHQLPKFKPFLSQDSRLES